MNIGYARVSRAEQNLDLQREALERAGCDPERIYEEKGSGAKDDRPVLAEVLRTLRDGDTLMVWKLDRLGRSLSHLIRTVEELGKRGVEFRSITEGMETATPAGRLIFHVAGAFAQFERDLIIERTRAGLLRARARGRFGGRPPKLSREDQREVRRLYDERRLTVGRIARQFRVGTSTVYRALECTPSTAPETGP